MRTQGPARIELLKTARTLLRRKGAWIQGSYMAMVKGVRASRWNDKDTSYCAIGAIERATEIHDADYNIQSMAGNDLAEAVGLGRRGAVEGWNDEDERTKREIIDAFTAAIVMLELDATP